MVSRIQTSGFMPGAEMKTARLSSGDSNDFAQKLQQAQAASSAGSTAQDKDELREAVRAVEAFFLSELLKTMRQSIPEGGLFPRSFAHETYEAMLDEQYAEKMAHVGGIGLGDLLYDQLSRHIDEEA